VAISVNDVLILVRKGLEVHQVAPDCNAGGNTYQMIDHTSDQLDEDDNEKARQ